MIQSTRSLRNDAPFFLRSALSGTDKWLSEVVLKPDPQAKGRNQTGNEISGSD
jgi:hypothetical protein